LLIAFFGVNNSIVEGRTRIQKDICILKYRDQLPFNFEFESYFYGPYSEELADTIDTLVTSGILEQRTVRFPNGERRYDYKLTDEGNSMFKIIRSRLRNNQELMSTLKNRIRQLKKLSIPETVSAAKKCSGMQSTK
jgi:uncharacterized protein YwgA